MADIRFMWALMDLMRGPVAMAFRRKTDCGRQVREKPSM
jgi:hypothetical protein